MENYPVNQQVIRLEVLRRDLVGGVANQGEGEVNRIVGGVARPLEVIVREINLS